MFHFHQRQNTTTWPEQAEQAIDAVAAEVKTTAGELLDSVHQHTEQAQDKASQLIHKLKHSVDALSDSSGAQAQALGARAAELSAALQEDVGAGWHHLKQGSRETVQKHPLASVLVAAGAGLLLGYLLTKQSEK